MTTLQLLNTWLLGLGVLLPGLLFLALYVPFVRIRTWAGWNVVGLTLALVALSLAAIARRIWGEWDWYQAFAAVALLIAAFAMWQRLIHLVHGPTFNWRVLRRRKRDDK